MTRERVRPPDSRFNSPCTADSLPGGVFALKSKRRLVLLDRRVVHLLLFEGPAELKMSDHERRVDLERLAILLDRLVVFALQIEDASELRVVGKRKRVELEGSISLGESFVEAPEPHEMSAVPAVCGIGIG